jgi:hypothetical protein
MAFDQKLLRFIKHGAQHRSNFLALFREAIVISGG